MAAITLALGWRANCATISSQSDAGTSMCDYRSRVPPVNTKGKREPYTEREMKASLRAAYSKSARQPWAQKEERPHLDADTSPDKPGIRPVGRVPEEMLLALVVSTVALGAKLDTSDAVGWDWPSVPVVAS
jgi:hypothetical protein